MMNYLKLILMTVLTVSVVACKSETDRPKVKSPVLATVNGEAITQRDVVLATEKLFSSQSNLAKSEKVKKRALESMVMVVALSQESQKKATEDELLSVETKVKRYREELMTELYLRKYAEITPPTESELLGYYENNLDQFGEEVVKEYSLIRTKTKPIENDQADILNRLKAFKNQSDWVAIGGQLKKTADKDFELVSGTSDVSGLDKQLKALLNNLDVDQVSNVVFIDKKPHLVKVTKQFNKDARPYFEVKNKIKKILTAKNLKQQIKVVSDKVVANSEVEYFQE